MTAKEMQRRNGKAQQLRVIQVEEGHYFVESSDGKIAYKAMLTDDKAFCTCLDFHKNTARILTSGASTCWPSRTAYPQAGPRSRSF